MRTRLTFTLLVLAAATAVPQGAAAAPVSAPAATVDSDATIFVAPGGDDSRVSTTSSAPVATLQRALRLATGGQRILLAAGKYPAAKDDSARTRSVTVQSYNGRVEVNGLTVSGGQRMTFSGIRFTESVKISNAKSVVFANVDVTSAKGSHCVVLRDGARDVTFRDSSLHNCAMGFAGAGGAVPSSGIRIVGNFIHDVTSDGIQFGDWSDVTVSGNRIIDIRDPAGVIHNDAIQLTGDSSNVLIADNVLAGSSGQLIIMQANVGPIVNVRVINNVLTDSDAIPIQSAGVSRLSIVHNTIWFGNGHGILIRTVGGIVGTDVAIVDNLTTAVETYGGGKITYASGNVTSCPKGAPKGGMPAGVATCLVEAPTFVDPANLDFRLAASSPLRNTVPSAAVRDLAGTLRLPMTSPGAFA